jgi:hypothetical protein
MILLIFSQRDLASQISDLRGGGAGNVGTVRFHNLSSGLSGIYGNFASTTLSNKSTHVDLSAIFRYHDNDFGEYSLAYVNNKNLNSFGVVLVQFGAEDYFERKLQLSYARKMFENGALGINFNLMNIQNVELGNSFNPTIDLSFYSAINDKLSIGTSLRNLLKTNADVIQYPSIVSLALYYQTSKVIRVGVEGAQIIDRPFDLKLLFEYQPSSQIQLNFGVDVLNQNIGLGFNYLFNTYKLGIASGQSNRLPMSTGISFGYLK